MGCECSRAGTRQGSVQAREFTMLWSVGLVERSKQRRCGNLNRLEKDNENTEKVQSNSKNDSEMGEWWLEWSECDLLQCWEELVEIWSST